MFDARIDSAVFKELKHLNIDAEKPISDFTEEAIQDLFKSLKR